MHARTVFIVVGMLCIPQFLYAASITIGITRGENEWRATYQLATEGAVLNAFEGSLLAPDGITVKRIETGRSVVQLWPLIPRYSGNYITFAGVIPGGFSGSAVPSRGLVGPGEIFTVVFSSELEVGVLPTGEITGYLHDGVGTRVTIPVPEVAFDAYVPHENVFEDRTPPSFVTAEIVSDPRLLLLDARDKETGVARYEVRFGNREWIHVEPPVVLDETHMQKRIAVRVFDHAGNFREVQMQDNVSFVSVRSFLMRYGVYIFIGVALLVIGIYAVHRRWFRK